MPAPPDSTIQVQKTFQLFLLFRSHLSSESLIYELLNHNHCCSSLSFKEQNRITFHQIDSTDDGILKSEWKTKNLIFDAKYIK